MSAIVPSAGEGLADLLTACTVHLDVPGGGGTGFFVAPGWVLTCAHVVASSGAGEVRVRGSAGEAAGRVAAQHPDRPPAHGVPYPFPDLALVRVDGWPDRQPCAWLGEALPVLDGRLHARGYTGTWKSDRPSGEPALFTFEGMHEVDGGGLLKMAAGEAVPGMSGGPLLDMASGRVCGVVKTTRDARAPRGGWAVPTRVLREFQAEVWAAHDRFHEDDQRWREVAERWAELARLLLEPPLPRPERLSASYLLGAEFEVVAFRGRKELLDQLESWCEEPGGFGVRLITGPGGQGKSRSARQLATRMSTRGWLAGLAQSHLSEAALGRLRATSTPCLLVIDYAEGRGDQVAGLVDALLGAERSGPVRLLLLARAAGDWWAELRSSTRRLEHALEGAVEAELPPLEDTLEGRQQAYAASAVAFAQQLGRQAPDVPVPDLSEAQYGSVLQLHMAALAAMLPAASPDGGEGTSAVADPSARLLDHERRYWRQAAQAAGLAYDQMELARAVAAATLCGVDNEAMATSLLGRVPGLPGVGHARLARLIRQLYPSRSGYWSGLQPDLLGEELVAKVTADPVVAGGPAGLLAALLAEASEEQAHQALTVLARAAPRHAHLRDALGPLLRADPQRLVPPAVAVATQARDPGPLVLALRQVLEVLEDSRLVLELVNRLPEHSIVLAELAVETTRRALDYHRAQAWPDPARIAGLLNDFSIRLSDVGRREDALHAVEEAVGYFRQLADAAPDAFRPSLATALSNLSGRLGGVGRREEALGPIEEAVGHYRQLAQAAPDAFLPDLAMALNNLSNRLGGVGRREEALGPIEEAVGHYRRLADAAPDAFLSTLAAALSNLSIRLNDVGRWEDALHAGEEAVGHYRRLAEAAPDAFMPDLANALNSLSIWLAGVGRRENALYASEEAVGYYLRLAEAGSDAFLPGLAGALNELSNHLGGVGQQELALGAVEEAVGYYRRLAEAAPDAFLPDLAGALSNLSIRLNDVGRQEDGMHAVEEAVGYYRRLAVAAPDAFLPGLAMALNNLSIWLAGVGRPEEALGAVEEAVGYYRRLAEAAPDAFLPDLAEVLNNLSGELAEVGRPEEALGAVEEAVGHYRQLAEAAPDAFLPRLAMALSILSGRLADVGRQEDAVRVQEDLTRILRDMGYEDDSDSPP